MNEKHSVIAGFDPRPAKKYPIAIIATEFAIVSKKTPKVQMTQEIIMAILRPRLSAIKGMIKKPIRDPINTIDCKTVEVESQSKYGSNSKMMLLE